MSVAFDLPSITLYDAQRSTVAVTVRGDEITRDLTPTVTHDVEACDRAFVAQQATLQLDVLAAAVDGGGTRVSNAGAVVALVVVACVLVAAGLFYCLAAAVRFVRKKQQLEMARALQVRDQVAAAVEKIQEFQAIFATPPATRSALEKLVPHEALRKDLVIYDAIADVAAETQGLAFVFLSHQWLRSRRRIPRTSTARRCSGRACCRRGRGRAAASLAWVSSRSPAEPVRAAPSIASLPTFASSPSVRQSNLTLPLVQASRIDLYAGPRDFFVIVGRPPNTPTRLPATRKPTGSALGAGRRPELLARNGRGAVVEPSDGLRRWTRRRYGKRSTSRRGPVAGSAARGDPRPCAGFDVGSVRRDLPHRHAPRVGAYEFWRRSKKRCFRARSPTAPRRGRRRRSAEETLFEPAGRGDGGRAQRGRREQSDLAPRCPTCPGSAVQRTASSPTSKGRGRHRPVRRTASASGTRSRRRTRPASPSRSTRRQAT